MDYVCVCRIPLQDTVATKINCGIPSTVVKLGFVVERNPTFNLQTGTIEHEDQNVKFGISYPSSDCSIHWSPLKVFKTM